MFLENLNKDRTLESVRSPIVIFEKKGIYANEYTRIHILYYQIFQDLEEIQSKLAVSVTVLFHVINKPQDELINLKDYSSKRKATETYPEAIALLHEIDQLKWDANFKWWDYLSENEEEIEEARQGIFKF